MISVQTNVNSLVAQQNLSVNSAFQSKTIQQLTSGYRINQSGDDAAGLAVANKFRSTVAELTQGVANGNDATAQLQIMDGGMSNISQILDRLKTLATQSASGTFTGNRTTVNSEFQNDLAEIDRQAQSIGLNTGGTFARNLDVYLGTGSGSSSLLNGVVTLNLTQSAVDSQSLGMKGMQAVGGTADLGTGSSTSVANILADTVNTGSTATAGVTDFYFKGPGFSDSSAVKVSVNLSGVSDLASLVTAFNAALGSAGTGTSQASSQFANAGIVASVKTNSDGTSQLALTSSTTAFQVESGDRMANALLGHFTGAGSTHGAAMSVTVTGGTIAAGTAAFSPNNKTVRISGAGLSSPVDLTFSSNDTLVSDAVTDLVNKVAANDQLKSAGISLTGAPGGNLVFTSSRGESFSVMATGDSTNQLGLGSFVTNASASNAVDYKSITGSNYSFATSANDQASMEFSVNGGAATAISIDLTGGDAVQSLSKSSAISNPTITASTASNTVGVTALSTHDWSAANQTFTVAVNGGSAQSVTLTTNFTLGGNNSTLLSEINSQLTGATASIDGGNHLVFTADKAGTTGSIVVGGTVANIGATWTQTAATDGTDMLNFSVDGIGVTAQLSGSSAAAATGAGNLFAAHATVTITAASSGASVGSGAVTAKDFTTSGAVTFQVAVDGGNAQTITLSGNMTNATDYLNSINGQLVGATASQNAGVLTITSNTTGTGSSIAITDGAGTSGFSAGAGPVTGHNFTLNNSSFTVDGGDGSGAHSISLNGNYTDASSYANRINAQAGTWVHATVTGASNDQLVITSVATGTSSNVTIAGGAATQAQVEGGAITAHDYSTVNGTFTVTTHDQGVVTVTLSGNDATAQNYVDDINNNNPHVGWHAALQNGHVAIISEDATPGAASSTVTLGGTAGVLTNLGLSSGTSSGNDTVVSYLNMSSGAGTAGSGPAVATYLHSQAGTTGVAGNDQMLVSSDLSGPKLVTIAAGTYGDNTGTTIQRAVNNALVSAGLLDSATTPTSGVVATLNGTGNLVLTSTTVGTASALSIAAPPSVYGTTSSALGGGGIGVAAGAHVGGSATAASLATQIQSAIDTATGTGGTNAHATVTTDATNHIIITNDTAGAAHSVSGFSGTATGWFGTGAGANHTDGLNRSGTDMASYLNTQFASTAALQPAQLQAVWTAGGTNDGTLQIVSANNTNFRVNSGSTGTGIAMGSAAVAAHNWSTGSERFALKINGVLSNDIVLTNNTADAAAVLAEVNRAMTAAGVTGVTASLGTGGDLNKLTFTSTVPGGASSIEVMTPAGGASALGTLHLGTKAHAADADVGFGVSGASFASGNLAASSPLNYVVDAGGASSANVSGNALSFSALKYGSDKQAITISANDSTGTQQSITVTLKNLATGAATDNRVGRNIDEAISYINQQLQASNISTLQKIVAVKENNSGDQINFMSSLSAFNVSVSSTANADGVNAGVSKNTAVGVVGEGANMAVDTQAGAQAAVTAIAAAVAKLGSAQAAVGKGQNQLTYAVNLAQSQITNFSFAESQIRDANVAQQAANLSKAQVLTQASIAAMAQANSAPQAVLSLLRG